MKVSEDGRDNAAGFDEACVNFCVGKLSMISEIRSIHCKPSFMKMCVFLVASTPDEVAS